MEEEELAPQGQNELAQPETEVPGAEVKDSEHQEPERKGPPPGWQKRIDSITAKRYEAERKAEAERQKREALERQLAELRGEEYRPQTDQPDMDSLIEQKLQERMRQAEMQQRTQKFLDQGYQTYGRDFDAKCDLVAKLGAADRLNEFMEVITDLDDGADVVSALADDPDRATHILSLPTHKMAIELAKLGGKKETPKPKISKAPEPIQPVDGGATSEPDVNEMTIAEQLEYIRKRGR